MQSSWAPGMLLNILTPFVLFPCISAHFFYFLLVPFCLHPSLMSFVAGFLVNCSDLLTWHWHWKLRLQLPPQHCRRVAPLAILPENSSWKFWLELSFDFLLLPFGFPLHYFRAFTFLMWNFHCCTTCCSCLWLHCFHLLSHSLLAAYAFSLQVGRNAYKFVQFADIKLTAHWKDEIFKVSW